MKDTLIPSFSCTLNADSHVEDSIPFQPETTLLFPIEQPERKEEKDDGKMTRKRKRSQSDSTQNQIRAVLTEFKVDNCEEQEGTQPEYDSIEKYIENEISPSLKPISSSHFLLSSENSNLPQPNPDLRTNSVSYPIHAQAPLTSPLSSRMRHNQRPLIQNSNEIQICQSSSTKSAPTCLVPLTDTVTIDMNGDAQNQDSKMSLFKLYITLTCFFVVVISCGLFASALPRLVRPRVTESYHPIEEEDVSQEDGFDKFTTSRTLRALKKEVGMVILFDEVEKAVPISMDDVYLDEIRSITVIEQYPIN